MRNRESAAYRLMRSRSTQLLTFGLFVGVCVAFAMASPVFLTPGNLLIILQQSAVLAVMSFGMVAVLIVSGGQADMSLAGVTGFVAAVAVSLLTRGSSTAVAILLAVGAGLAAGLVNGFLVTKVGLLPFLGTLATSNMAMGLEQVLTKGTSVPFADPFIGHVANGELFGIPASTFVVVAIFVCFLLLFDYTRVGRKIYAIGGNPQVARMSGVNVERYTMLAFVLSGFSAGIAGVILMGRLSGLTPLAASHLHLDVLLAGYVSAILSTVGAPGMAGALFGALFVGVLSNGLAVSRVPTFYMNLVKGLLIIIVVAANAVQRRRRTA